MKIFKKIISFIVSPFSTFGLGKTSDKVVKFNNKHPYFIYILSFIISAGIIVFYYFI